jgi:hypothetical protein
MVIKLSGQGVADVDMPRMPRHERWRRALGWTVDEERNQALGE